MSARLASAAGAVWAPARAAAPNAIIAAVTTASVLFMIESPPVGDALEPEAEPARELELVRVLGVARDVAAPVGITPPAVGVGLDVGGRPARPELHADVVAGIELDAQPPGRGELRL